MVQWLRLHLAKLEVSVSLLAWELRSHMPPSKKSKIQNTSNTVTNPIQMLKMVYI